MSNVKWISAAAGWFFAGPIGGIIGYYIGKNFFNSKVDNKTAFEISLLILSSIVIKADGKVLTSELDYVKKFFINTFGPKKSNEYFRMFNNLKKQDLNSKLRKICIQLKSNINHSSRLEIIHFLFGVSYADNEIHLKEVEIIKKIANYMNINPYDFESIQSMFLANENSNSEKWYKILGLTKDATDSEVKKAYRKMAVKYHPDKLIGVSEDIKKLAEKKFLAVKEAYEQIKRKNSG
ncbi:MAG: molecular chaperone DjlA [Flavobacteriales bacterium]|nr:molecular chaperone DjlA [Flavobacteriales bacterium]|tara:strand:- start:4889 stop:5596 length:708 start_codon:yes stop_codon:yes gene_type:complete